MLAVQEKDLDALTQTHATRVSDHDLAAERAIENDKNHERRLKAAQKQAEYLEAKLRKAEATILELHEELKKENRPHDELRARLDELKVIHAVDHTRSHTVRLADGEAGD